MKSNFPKILFLIEPEIRTGNAQGNPNRSTTGWHCHGLQSGRESKSLLTITLRWIPERAMAEGITISLQLTDLEMNTRTGYVRGKISICLPLNDTEMKSKANNARGNLNLSTAESHRDGFPNHWIKKQR